MSSEGEAEAAAESGPGSTPAPGAAAAEREEVSGSGGVRPGPGRAGGDRRGQRQPRRGDGVQGRGVWGAAAEEGAPAGGVCAAGRAEERS